MGMAGAPEAHSLLRHAWREVRRAAVMCMDPPGNRTACKAAKAAHGTQSRPSGLRLGMRYCYCGPPPATAAGAGGSAP